MGGSPMIKSPRYRSKNYPSHQKILKDHSGIICSIGTGLLAYSEPKPMATERGLKRAWKKNEGCGVLQHPTLLQENKG